MSSVREFACSLPFGELRGLRCGQEGGRKVLALHGWLDNAASFLPLAQMLPGLDLVMIDLPGHGHSAALPAGSEYTMIGAIGNVLAVADALGWDHFSLLGHSMGAGIASLVAAAVPARVQALAVIEALGGLGEQVENTAQRLRDSVEAAHALPGKPLRVFPNLEAPVRARMMINQLSEPSARLLVERGVRAVPEGYSWGSDQRLTLPTAVRMTEAQIDVLVAAIECPTLVVFASPAQPYFPEPLRTRRAQLLRDGRLHVIAGTHHLHMEIPEAVAALVQPFLDEHAPLR